MTKLLFELHVGSAPLLVSIPHMGTVLPEDIRAAISPEAEVLSDTDWHLDRLYHFAREMGASILCATISRYAIDLNRPPSGESLYPGQTTTGLCPTETFRGVPLYLPGAEPDEAEVARRRERYWQPYHDALQGELQRLRQAHGQVLLWDAHSIASELPRLFEGTLPALNFGTNSGGSCSTEISAAVLGVMQTPKAAPFSHVLNGRFKGGFITRNYGNPAAGVQAIQLEMRQNLYMNESPPFAYRSDLAEQVQPLIQELMQVAIGQLRR